MAGWWKSLKNNSEKTEAESLASANNPFINKNLPNSFEEFGPKNYEDVEIIANALILQKSVKLNLENTAINDRRRIIDFLCGIAYVLNFSVRKIDVDLYEFRLN